MSTDARSKAQRIDQIVDSRLRAGNFRHEIAQHVPEGATRIMEYGFGDGSLPLWLRRDKKCREIYGVEVDPKACERVKDLYDMVWLMDLNDPQSDLGSEYENHFNYILAPMSLEHTMDPWYVLKKFNRYLAPGGKIVLEVPNAQSWEAIYRLLTGDFPYVSGGTWDYKHIRWYTLKSLADLAFVAGFKLADYSLLFPVQVNLQAYQQRKEITTLQLPPPELGLPYPPIAVKFPLDIKPIYPLFLAHVLVAVLEKTREPEDFDPTPAGGYLESYRLAVKNPLAAYAQLLNHPIVPHLMDTVIARAKKLREIISTKS